MLRTGKPDKARLKFILRGHKAPTGRHARRITSRMQAPTAADVQQILVETPDTVFLTVSRRAAHELNEYAVAALFAGQQPLSIVPITADEHEDQMQVKVYKGMRLTLTKNLNKKIGFVNGMGAEALSLHSSGFLVKTDQGRKLMVHLWTDEHGVSAFPFRMGYASTLHKVQGATLRHITLWLDLANMPAAGYVALSRVQKDSHWRYIGDPTRHHFTPARFD